MALHGVYFVPSSQMKRARLGERVRDLTRLVQCLIVGPAVPRAHVPRFSLMAMVGKICAAGALEKSL